MTAYGRRERAGRELAARRLERVPEGLVDLIARAGRVGAVRARLHEQSAHTTSPRRRRTRCRVVPGTVAMVNAEPVSLGHTKSMPSYGAASDRPRRP